MAQRIGFVCELTIGRLLFERGHGLAQSLEIIQVIALNRCQNFVTDGGEILPRPESKLPLVETVLAFRLSSAAVVARTFKSQAPGSQRQSRGKTAERIARFAWPSCLGCGCDLDNVGRLLRADSKPFGRL